MPTPNDRVDISTLPLVYRALFLYFEPLAALLGTFTLHVYPSTFLNGMCQGSRYASDNQIIYDQLAGTYMLFAFNEAVVLRLTRDMLVWRAIIIGTLLCDALHIYASWTALGSSVFWDPRAWRVEDWSDWINLGSLWGQAAIRVAFLLQIGFNKSINIKRK